MLRVRVLFRFIAFLDFIDPKENMYLIRIRRNGEDFAFESAFEIQTTYIYL